LRLARELEGTCEQCAEMGGERVSVRKQCPRDKFGSVRTAKDRWMTGRTTSLRKPVDSIVPRA
jgi:hypothetical protein